MERGHAIVDVPGEAYQMIGLSDIVDTIRLMAEELGMTLVEILDALGGLYMDADVQPIDKPAERQNPITGLLATHSTLHSYSHLERWHTAATGE